MPGKPFIEIKKKLVRKIHLHLEVAHVLDADIITHVPGGATGVGITNLLQTGCSDFVNNSRSTVAVLCSSTIQ